MQVPGLGEVTRDERTGWDVSGPMPISVLGRPDACIGLIGYREDPDQEDFHRAIRAFLGLDHRALRAAAEPIFDYYQDHLSAVPETAEWCPPISGPDQVLDHVTLGDAAFVERDHEDHRIYVKIECECAWEEEHGLMLVFRDGLQVSKVGPYDDHLTNASAFGREELRDVVYVRQ